MQLHIDNIPDNILSLPLVYQTQKIEFFYDESQSLLVSWAKKFSNDEEYRENMLKCLDLVQKNQIKKIIFESSRFKGTSSENQKWIMDFMVPSWAAAGTTRIGSVLPLEMFGKFSINNMIQGALTLGLVEIKPFTNFEECYKWINS
ncbi:MAG: hypothetical protein EAZ06_03375 [Cytophagales bacterium]|nr:MAG: hypothetical protein EAY69_07920 [Cytophagales bacterium]TAH30385.1 MAG: hypothetical protein EAZ06_03375 [Cytophagales bacterium]